MRRAPDLALLMLLAPAVASAGELAFVTCQNGDELSVIDLDAGEELERWSVPGKPAGVAVAKDGTVFTVSPDSKTVRRFGGDGHVTAEATLPGGPVGIAHDDRRGRVFVSDWYNARVFVLDADALAVLDELSTGAAPAGLAISDNGAFLASADRDADQVSLFDAKTLTLIDSVAVGERPFGLAFGPGGRLFAANVGTNDVTVLKPGDGSVEATVPVGERPYGVAFAANRAFVSNQYEDTVSVIDLETLEHLTKVDVGEYPEGIDATSAGDRVVVANWFDNTVSIIDAHRLTVIHTVETCDGPRAFGAFLLGGTT